MFGPTMSDASAPLRPLVEQIGRFQIPSLDGVRCLSFLIVFVAHAWPGHGVPGGFGVTVFFFLSGYLITSLLRKEYEASGRINLKHFYYRRILRIFPPMYITIAILIGATLIGVLPGVLSGEALTFQSLFLTNYYSLFGTHPHGIPEGSGVFWSLAVEEHFYMLFPFLAMLAMPRLSRGKQAIVICVMCALVLAWRCVLVIGFDVPDNRTYYSTDTRIDSILFGCALAVWCNPFMDRPLVIKMRRRFVLYGLAGGMLLVGFVWRDPVFRETARYTLQGIALLIGFYLVIHDHKAWWFRWLAWKPVRFIGVLSYTLYLIHYSALYAFRLNFPEWNAASIGVAALAFSFVFAVTMYYLIEKPCARMRRKLHDENDKTSHEKDDSKPRAGRLRRALIAVLILGVVGVISGELLARITWGLGNPVIASTDPEVEYIMKPNEKYYRFKNRIQIDELGLRNDAFPYSPAASDEQMRIVFVGDSIVYGGHHVGQNQMIATKLRKRLIKDSEAEPVVCSVAASSWGPQNMLAFVERHGLFEPDVVVLVLSAHDLYDTPTFTGVGPYETTAPFGALHDGWRVFQRRRGGSAGSALIPSTPKKQTTDEHIVELLKRMKATGARTLCVLHPTRGNWDTPSERLLRIKALADQASVPTIWTGDALLESLQQGHDPFRDTIHPNAIGTGIIARRIHEALWPEPVGSDDSNAPPR